MTQQALCVNEDGSFNLKNEEQLEEEREKKRYRDFYIGELGRLERIKRIIEGLKFDYEEIEEERWITEWWYCNHIEGWNNNIPAKGKTFDQLYSGVPENELLADSIRGIWNAEERYGIYWDKNFALERLNRAIKGYKKLLNKEKQLEIKT